MPTTLITGGAGMIGSHLADDLLERDHHVIVVDNFNDYYSPDQKQLNVAASQQHPNYTLYPCDIRWYDQLLSIFERHRPDTVIHLAAMANVRYAIDRDRLYHDVNTTGTLNVLEAAHLAGVNHVVFGSTSSVYGNAATPFVETDAADRPLSAYPASKRAGELYGHHYARLYDMHFTALRFFSVYGPRARPDMMPFMLMDRISKGKPIAVFGDGSMSRDWTFVDDIVEGIRLAAEKPRNYRVFNLGRGEPVALSDLIECAEHAVGQGAIIDRRDVPASEAHSTCASIKKAKQTLGYNPTTSISDGFLATWEWFSSRFPV